jgi:hypothetical protein
MVAIWIAAPIGDEAGRGAIHGEQRPPRVRAHFGDGTCKFRHVGAERAMAQHSPEADAQAVHHFAR